MHENDVLVAIIHFGDTEPTKLAVESVARAVPARSNIVVISNNSLEADRGLPPDTEIRNLGHNAGYAGGVNYAVQYARERGFQAVWILNNDLVVDPRALHELVNAFNSHQDADIVGSYVRDEQTVYFAGGRFSRITGRARNIGYGHSVSTVATDGHCDRTEWINGCSMFIPLSSLIKRGLFQSGYFLYKEELEWQIRTPGARAYIVRSFLVNHHAGGSGGSGSDIGHFMMARNGLRIAFDHARGALPMWLACWFVDYLARPALKGDARRMRLGVLALRTLRAPTDVVAEQLR